MASSFPAKQRLQRRRLEDRLCPRIELGRIGSPQSPPCPVRQRATVSMYEQALQFAASMAATTAARLSGAMAPAWRDERDVTHAPRAAGLACGFVIGQPRPVAHWHRATGGPDDANHHSLDGDDRA